MRLCQRRVWDGDGARSWRCGVALVDGACPVHALVRKTCGVPGCGFDGPHAGAHGTPATPVGYCAPARCYCGECPSWTPRVELPADLDHVASEVASARAAVRAAREAEL